MKVTINADIEILIDDLLRYSLNLDTPEKVEQYVRSLPMETWNKHKVTIKCVEKM